MSKPRGNHRPMPLFAVLLDVIPKIEDGELAKMSTKPGLDGPNKEAKDLDVLLSPVTPE